MTVDVTRLTKLTTEVHSKGTTCQFGSAISQAAFAKQRHVIDCANMKRWAVLSRPGSRTRLRGSGDLQGHDEKELKKKKANNRSKKDKVGPGQETREKGC